MFSAISALSHERKFVFSLFIFTDFLKFSFTLTEIRALFTILYHSLYIVCVLLLIKYKFGECRFCMGRMIFKRFYLA